jgi:hypothetical protein
MVARRASHIKMMLLTSSAVPLSHPVACFVIDAIHLVTNFFLHDMPTPPGISWTVSVNSSKNVNHDPLLFLALSLVTY